VNQPASLVEIYGVRHHGPGSARAVHAALDAFMPSVVLIEGPADADDLIPMLADAATEPPLALFTYAVDEPGHAAFWPFAVFSPEWQALSWAREHDVPVKFCDLPAAAMLAEPLTTTVVTDEIRRDPIAMLAEASGYDDPERWWDDVVESRSHGPGAFAAIAEAMTELRSATALLPDDERVREDRREAHMRTILRATCKTADRVAVVCGAWHVPALTAPLPAAAADAKLLAGLPKRKVALTWIGWTHSRLATASGYGAGVPSPGWYHHLFNSTRTPIASWLTKVANVLRAEDLPVSSAHVIEAVRLAETLAVMRGRALAGLAEVTEATRSVMCDGDDVALALVTQRLVVGEALGTAPLSAPMVPLEQDLRAQARTLRLKFEADPRPLDLDVRKDGDLARSHLLHRLSLLGIPWGKRARGEVRSKGTFHETWRLLWAPELQLGLVDAARLGATVEDAASAKLIDSARSPSTGLAALSAAVELALLADLPRVFPDLLTALDARAAGDVDVTHLMDALPALVQALRYGNVRRTDLRSLGQSVDTMLIRICAALPAAAGNLDDEAAAVFRRHITATHTAVHLLENPPDLARWLDVLAGLADRSDLHGLLAGLVTRMLRDSGRLDADAAALRFGRALSLGASAATKAAWIEGFLAGGGMLLIHDDGLLALLDDWVCALPSQAFVDVLPLLRRAFGSFASGERRAIGEQIKRGSKTRSGADDGDDLDYERAAPALATVALLMGLGS
jgi:hypothetical protein